MSAVTLISQAAPPSRGGLAVATGRIAELATRRGEKVDVVVLGKDAAPGGRAPRELDGYTVHTVGRLTDAEASLRALVGHATDIARTRGSTLIHGIYASEPGYAAQLVGADLGLPTVVSIRGNDLDRGLYRAQTQGFVRQALTGATVVTGVSRAHCQLAARLFGRQVMWLGNSVDSDRFKPEAKDHSLVATMGLGDDPVIGYVGELREKKGLRFLLPAFARLAQERSLRLLLIGGLREEARPAFAEFRRLAPEAAERVHICEYARSPKLLSRLLALCDLLVFPSLMEGMPNAVLEAMACARPVLATAVGGHLDIIEHGRDGALLELSDLAQLPEAIAEMLDREDLESLGQAARARVRRDHQPAAESQAWAEVYAKARSGGPRFDGECRPLFPQYNG